MPRTGRPRKAAIRYPGGKIRRESDGAPPAQIVRMIRLAAAGAADATLATQLGWLRLHRVVTDRQAGAGLAFAALTGQHERTLGLPRRTASSPSYEQGFGRSAPDLRDDSADRVATIRRRYDAASSVLRELDARGRVAEIVTAVCVDDRAPAWDERGDLTRGLDALARHFGLR
jgi:hypothetical protein